MVAASVAQIATDRKRMPDSVSACPGTPAGGRKDALLGAALSGLSKGILVTVGAVALS